MAEEPKPQLNIQPQIIMNTQLVYANTITVNMSQSDVTIVFIANGRPVIGTAMSLPVAKHLQETLEKALSSYEKKTNTKIVDIKEVTEQLKKP